jgi:hypothetical protein
MRKEFEQRMIERWPQWFDTEGDIRHTLMPWGFTHDDGWFDILWRLCEDLEPLVTEFEETGGPMFEVLQVKEKFGGLRFYVNCRNDAIRQRILVAQEGVLPYLRGLRATGKTAGGWSDQDFVRRA